MKPRKNKKGSLGRLFLWGFLIVLVSVIGVGAYGYFWVQNYLQSDAFRVMLSKQLGRETNSEANLETLSLNGPILYVSEADLTSKAARGWKQINASGLRANVDWNAARQGVWKVTRLTGDRLQLQFGGEGDVSREEENVPELETSMPGWLKNWIPKRTEIESVVVETFEIASPAKKSGLELTDVRLKAKPAADPGAWQLTGENRKDALLKIPGIAAPFHLKNASARLDSKAFTLHDASATWIGSSEVVSRGSYPFAKDKGWSFNGHLAGLDLAEVLSPDWKGKINGVLEGDYNIDAADLSASLTLKNGIVQNIPVQNRIADFTRTERFRRIVLDQASGDVSRSGNTTKVTNLILQSDGLMRIEGDLTIQGKALRGTLDVGISPDTLRWIPGSQLHVFTDKRAKSSGFVWTRVQLNGTIDQPTEDLSNRILAAAGKELLETSLNAAGAGVDVLNTASGTAAKTGESILKGEKGVIEGTTEAAGTVIEKGVDTLKSLVPFLDK